MVMAVAQIAELRTSGIEGPARSGEKWRDVP
jgi:hypothetical protein